MKLILQLFLLVSVANAKYLRRTQESKLFHFFPAVAYVAASEGIVPEPSTEGTDNLSQLKSGDFIHYAIQMPVEESYLLQVRLASPDGNGSFDITNADTGEVYATFDNLPASGNWQRYRHINRFVILPAGEYILSVNVKEAGWNLLWMYFKQQDGTLAPTPAVTSAVTSVVDPSISMAPVMNTVNPTVFPTVSTPDEVEKWASMIDAADFSIMQGVELETSSEGIRSVAFLDPGDYMEYMIDFPVEGKYRVSISVASPDGDGALEMDVGTQLVVAFVDGMPVTGDWQKFETVTVQIQVTTTGLQPVRINVLEPGWNLLWLYFYHDMAQDCTPTPAPSTLKESSTHDCDDEALPVPLVPEPTPEPTSAPTDCHNSNNPMDV